MMMRCQRREIKSLDEMFVTITAAAVDFHLIPLSTVKSAGTSILMLLLSG